MRPEQLGTLRAQGHSPGPGPGLLGKPQKEAAVPAPCTGLASGPLLLLLLPLLSC